MLAFHAPPDASTMPVTRCVAEYFHFKGQIYTTEGLGAIISKATDNGQFQVLLSATILMAAAVVTINRFVWRRLYHLAETRFRLET
jgi:NitT/TauT family transport system permease protein